MKNKFINKKKFFFFNVNLIIVIILTCFIFFIFVKFQNIINVSIKSIEFFSNKYNYNLSKIEINNLDNIERDDILIYLKPYKNKSIFLVPLNKITENIKQITWVKNIKIKNDFKNTLYLSVDEEEPLGVYVNNNQNILFSKNLIILEIIKNDEKYFNLIRFYGKNSIYKSKKLISDLENFSLSDVKSAIFIENRRWNLKLKNLITLKLPENNIKKAFANYKKIYANLSNKELKDMESIDLRIKNQAIIKYRN